VVSIAIDFEILILKVYHKNKNKTLIILSFYLVFFCFLKERQKSVKTTHILFMIFYKLINCWLLFFLKNDIQTNVEIMVYLFVKIGNKVNFFKK